MTDRRNLAKSKLKDLPKQLREQRGSTPLNRSAIGREGLEVYDGGWIRILNGGLEVVGTAVISGVLRVTGTLEAEGTNNLSGTNNFTGENHLVGPTDVAGDFEIIEGGLFKSGSVEIKPDGSAKFGTLEIDSTGVLSTGKTKIETSGKATFGSLVIDPDSLYLFRAPGGWLAGSGPDDMTLASSESASVSLNSQRAELNFQGQYVRLTLARTYISNRLDLAAELYVTGGVNFSSSIINFAGLGTVSNPPNLWINPTNGRIYRTTWTPA